MPCVDHRWPSLRRSGREAGLAEAHSLHRYGDERASRSNDRSGRSVRGSAAPRAAELKMPVPSLPFNVQAATVPMYSTLLVRYLCMVVVQTHMHAAVPCDGPRGLGLDLRGHSGLHQHEADLSILRAGAIYYLYLQYSDAMCDQHSGTGSSTNLLSENRNVLLTVLILYHQQIVEAGSGFVSDVA